MSDRKIKIRNGEGREGKGWWGMGRLFPSSPSPCPLPHSPFFPLTFFRSPLLSVTCRLVVDSPLARMAFDQFDANFIRPFDKREPDLPAGDRANLIGHLHSVFAHLFQGFGQIREAETDVIN